MNDLVLIIIASLAGGLLSILLAATIAFRLSSRLNNQLIAFAAGVMLSAACLDILPEAFEAFAHASPDGHAHGATQQLFGFLLAGILLFFTLERLALWRHSHGPAHAHEAEHHHAAQSAAALILIGDAFHNFVDGILIAATFLVDTSLGIATTAAIIAHEVPQELGDFVLLINAGWSKPRALFANAASSLTSVLGGVIGFLFLESAEAAIPYVLTLAASSFLYIAIADLLPMLHRQLNAKYAYQAGWILCGVLVIPLVTQTLHHH